jgi:hypothetical protein
MIFPKIVSINKIVKKKPFVRPIRKVKTVQKPRGCGCGMNRWKINP